MKTKLQEKAYKEAISQYLGANNLQTDYMKSFSWDEHAGCFSIFDPPESYDPSIGIQDAPEYRAKPLLIAAVNPDGSITVKETEHTTKYMYKKP